MKKEMQNIENNKTRAVYTAMWENNVFAEKLSVRQTLHNGKLSKNSYVFNIPGYGFVDKRDGLKKIFAINNPDVFNKKFEEACGGSGNELKRITTLHSSSLCALLFFYNVTKQNPLVLELDGEKVIFTQSLFEVQNTVIPGHNPSNVDVVLIGKQNEKKVILFLESKFSEYYQSVGTSLDVSKEYCDEEVVSSKIYCCDEYMSKLGITKSIDIKKDCLIFQTADAVYIEGIKQMISHYVGICNFMFGNIPENERTKMAKEYFDSDTKVYLGAILFDKHIGELKIGKQQRSSFELYRERYERLAAIINHLGCHSNQFRILPSVLRYSLFENNSHNIEQNIMKFYFGN